MVQMASWFMPNNFWTKEKKPIMALAPMAGYSNSAFRQLCRQYGARILYSEMASVAALYYAKNKKQNLTLDLLKFKRDKERPYVVQLFGSDPEQFALAARIISETVKPDGLDINFGCPVPKILKQGAGSKLFSDVNKSREVIQAVLANTKLPLSIKVRTEAFDVNLLDFLKNISDLKISALMIHCRSLQGGFSAMPDWKIVKKARKYFSGLILVNGGIVNRSTLNKALAQSGADGAGIARGACGNPWIFSGDKPNDFREIFAVALKHAKLVPSDRIVEMRAHLPFYVAGLKDAASLRSKLVKVESLQDIKNIFSDYEKHFTS